MLPTQDVVFNSLMTGRTCIPGPAADTGSESGLGPTAAGLAVTGGPREGPSHWPGLVVQSFPFVYEEWILSHALLAGNEVRSLEYCPSLARKPSPAWGPCWALTRMILLRCAVWWPAQLLPLPGSGLPRLTPQSLSACGHFPPVLASGAGVWPWRKVIWGLFP